MPPQPLTIASVNLTNAIPKRVRLICESVSESYTVTQICWSRHPGIVTDSHTVNIASGSILTYLVRVWVHLLRGGYDVILFDDLRLLPVLTTLRRIKGVRLAYNRQEVPNATLTIRLQSKIRMPFSWAAKVACWLEGILGRRVAGVITIPVNSKQTSYLESWKRPILALANYPELSTVVYKERTRQSKSLIQMIYSGAIRPETGLYQYLELVSRLNSDDNGLRVGLTLVGHVWDSSPNRLSQLITKYGCTGSVEYLEWVPYEQLQNIYKSSDIALAYADPNHYKYSLMEPGSSRKIFTYMAAGLPILAGGAFSETVEKEAVGLRSEFEDRCELLKNAVLLARDGELRDSMSGNGVRAIEQEYNWDKYRKTILDFFNRIASDPGEYVDKPL